MAGKVIPNEPPQIFNGEGDAGPAGRRGPTAKTGAKAGTKAGAGGAARPVRQAEAARPAKHVPVDADAERAVIAALLTSPDAFYDISLLLSPEDFGVDTNADIYRAVLACDAAGKPVDQITVADELKRQKALTRVGGAPALTSLVEEAANAGNVIAHGNIVSDKALLRRLLTTGQTIAGGAITPGAVGHDALTAAETSVFDLGRQRSGSTMVEMPQAVAEMLQDLAKSRTALLLGHSTGWADLDRMTGGLQAGQLITVAARPAMGKSAFALSLARHIAESTGLLVPFLSYEMSRSELSMRMLSTALKYDLLRLRQGDMPTDMERDLAVAAEKMALLPVLIDDNPPETIGGVRSAMRRLARRGQVGAVVIDYLQLMSGDGRHSDENRTQEVSAISRGLKRLADELECPVIACSQLNRQLENRPNKRPQLSDLRESGSIEQDSSVVLMLYREVVYNAAADPTLAELIIAKQRNGPIGVIHLEFASECALFTDTTRRPANTSSAAPAGGYGRTSSDPF